MPGSSRYLGFPPSVFCHGSRPGLTHWAVLAQQIDIDKCRELSEEESIQSVPTFKIFRQGEEVKEINGANGSELQRVLSGYSGN